MKKSEIWPRFSAPVLYESPSPAFRNGAMCVKSKTNCDDWPMSSQNLVSPTSEKMGRQIYRCLKRRTAMLLIFDRLVHYTRNCENPLPVNPRWRTVLKFVQVANNSTKHERRKNYTSETMSYTYYRFTENLLTKQIDIA